jgi:hypothetical protein
MAKIKLLYLRARPRSAAEKFQARLHARITEKAIDANLIAEPLPSVGRVELGDDGFEGFAVKRVFRSRVGHESAQSTWLAGKILAVWPSQQVHFNR